MKTTLIILSDTHLPKRGAHLPDLVLHQISRADYVVHAGDFTSREFVDFLRQFPLIGVSGNRDERKLRELFAEKQLVDLNGFRIGLVHGGPGKNSLKTAMESFKAEKLDLLIFGHSHVPYLERQGDMWIMNPGSPTVPASHYERSYGIVELGKVIEPRIVYF